MKKALFVGIATLLGLGACDAEGDTGTEGTNSGSTSSAETTATAGETASATSPSTTPDSATSTTTSPGSSSSGSSATETQGSNTDSDGESSGVTSDGGSNVTPCQPEMSRADIERWTGEADSRMPTLADLVLPLANLTAQSGTAGSFSDVPDPQGGGSGFITDPDGGGLTIECSVWDQDCDAGEKCAAWASDGASSWNATRCVPLDADPVGVGEACTVEGSGVSGIDNCDGDSMCWDVDGETNEGTCVALCEGSENAPTCAPEGTACSISNEGVLIVCLPICNPLADECGNGQACYPSGEFFQCAPDASGEDQGQPGDSCEFVNACDNGTGCVNSALVPTCPAGSSGCCSSFCDLTAEEPGCLEGQECLPWYEMGQEPDACLEGVGICSGPA